MHLLASDVGGHSIVLCGVRLHLDVTETLQICRPCHDSGRPLNADARIRSEACLSEICARQSGTVRVLRLPSVISLHQCCRLTCSCNTEAT